MVGSGSSQATRSGGLGGRERRAPDGVRDFVARLMAGGS